MIRARWGLTLSLALFAPGISAPLLLLGCASGGNTPAQDLAWERWNRCKDKLPVARLEGAGVSPDGQISFYPRTAEIQLCLDEAAQEQATRGAAPR